MNPKNKKIGISEAKKRTEKLKKLLEYHRILYHTFDSPELSDSAFDALKNELEALEKQFPNFAKSDSPTQKVGGIVLDKFEKVAHKIPMVSFNDAFNEEEVKEWKARIEKYLGIQLDEKNKSVPLFYCELKIDGLAIELIYENGVLVLGSTRGDGNIGENITENVKTIFSIPKKIEKLGKWDIPKQLIIRGEIFISLKELARINREQEKNGLKPYANTRNLAAGSVRQLDPKITASRKLESFQYEIMEGLDVVTHEEKHKALSSWGFAVNTHNKTARSLKEAYAFREYWETHRGSLPYEVDGIVILLNENKLLERGGIVGKSPRGTIAYKFSPKEATTQVEEIKIQVGRTGALTPVAVLKPVNVGGVTIRHATLHNFDEIARLEIRIGDTVVVSRAGDVIPQITNVLKDLRNGKEMSFSIPKKCPVDGASIVQDGSILRCSNSKCGARAREHLRHFVSRAAFDIRGFGRKIVDRFLDEGLISNAADIFELEEGDIANLDRFGEKSSKNLIAEIRLHKTISLPRFLFSLGILHVGQETAQLLANAFPVETIKKMIQIYPKFSFEKLQTIQDVGPKVAQSIIDWFKEKKNIGLLEQFEKIGISFFQSIKKERSGKFAGKLFVFTGTLSKLERENAKDKVRGFGGEVSESVSKKTSFVVVGENPGSKYEKAKELGVRIIDEKEFIKLLG